MAIDAADRDDPIADTQGEQHLGDRGDEGEDAARAGDLDSGKRIRHQGHKEHQEHEEDQVILCVLRDLGGASCEQPSSPFRNKSYPSHQQPKKRSAIEAPDRDESVDEEMMRRGPGVVQ